LFHQTLTQIFIKGNEDVPEFGPDIPKPNEFDQDDEFKHFLYAKSLLAFLSQWFIYFLPFNLQKYEIN